MSGKILTFFRKHKFLAAVLVVVLLVSGLIIFLHSPPGRSIVFSRIQSILKNNYEMNLTAGSLQYNLLNLSATLEKVRLEGNNQAIPVETFTSDYIRVNMGIRTFFSGVLHFQDIQIIRPEVKFHPPPETESSGETQAEAGLVRIRIDNLNLDQGRIAFESEPVSFYAVLSGIRLDVGFDPVTRTHAGLFSSENGRIDVQENQFHVDHIHLPFRFDSRSFEIQDFQLSSPILTFKAAGRVDEYQTSPDFDLNFSAAVEPQAAAEKLYLNQNFSGLIRLDGRLYSTPAGPGLDGHLTAEGFTAGELTVSSLLVEMSYQPSRIDLNQLVMSSRYGDITAEGVWFPGAEDTSRITLNWNKLHPMQILNRMSSHSIPLNTESRGHVQAEWTQMDLNQLKARIEAEFGAFSVPPEQSGISGRLQGTWDSGTATVNPSRLDFPAGSLELNGSMGSNHSIQGGLELDIESLSRMLSVLPPNWETGPVTGGLELNAELKGTISEPQLSVTVQSPGLSIRDLSLSQLTARIAYDRRTVSIQEFLVRTEEGKLQLDGHINAGTSTSTLLEETQLNLTISNLELHPVFNSFFPSIPIAGQLEGTAGVSGSLQEPQLEIDLEAAPLFISEKKINSAAVAGSSLTDRIVIRQMEIHKNKSLITGSGTWQPGRENFDFELRGEDIQARDLFFIPSEGPPLSGSINFNIEAGGSIDAPEGRLDLSVSQAGAGNIRLGDILVEGRSDGNRLTASIRTETGEARIQAQTQLNRLDAVQAEISLDDLNLGRYVPPKPGPQGPMPPFSTGITAQADLTIPLDHPLDLNGTLDINSLGFSYRGIQFTLPESASLKAENGTISVQNFNISGPQTELSLSGRFTAPANNQTGLSLSGKLNLHAFEPFVPGAHLAGTIAIQADLSGTLQKPLLEGEMTIESVEAGYNGFPYALENLQGQINLDTGTIQIKNFTADLAEGQIEAAGKIAIPGIESGTSQPESNRLSLQWSHLNPSAFDRFLPPQYSGQLDGDISGEMLATGQFSSLDSINLEGRLSRLRLELTPFQMAAEDDILFSLSSGIFHLRSLHLSGSQSSLQAQGRLDLKQKQPRVDGTVKLSLDGGAVSPLIDNALLSGAIDLNLDISGPVINPVLTGNCSLEDVYIQPQTLPLTLSNLEGDIQFSESSIEIPSLKASANGGPLTLSGNIQYSQLQLEQARLNLSFRQLQWNYPEGVNALNRGDLTLESAAGEWTLTGDVRIQQAFFQKDIYLGTELVTQIRLNRVRLQTEMPEFLQQLNLDIQIRTPGEVVVDNNLAELGLDANLIIQGTPLEPNISGLISNPFSGEMYFGDRSFQLERMQINFPGDDILDARINITAHTSMKDNGEHLDITLSVSGPVTDLKTSLTSFPSRSEIELASLLITGRSIENLKSGTANVISNQLLLYFATPVASAVTGQIESWLQAEEVRLEPINIATEEDPGARFTFRKSVIPRVDLIYSVDITNTQDQTWIMEYDLSRNFTLRAFRKDDGSYGSSLEHRFRVGQPDYIASETGTAPRNLLTGIHISGDLGFKKDILRRRLSGIEPGQTFNYSELRTSIDRLTKYYTKRNYLNTVINPRISYVEDNSVQVDIQISSGKPVFIDYQGYDVPNKLKRKIRRDWSGRLPENARLTEASNQISNHLKGKGYYQAEIKHSTETGPAAIRHIFTINRGAQFEIGLFRIQGKGVLAEKDIRKLIKNLPGAGNFGFWNIVRSFPQIQGELEKRYEEEGYMNARIPPPQIEIESETREINITLSIEPGKQSRVDRLDFQGLEAFAPGRLKESLHLVSGRIFRPALLAMDINYLINQYRSLGYQNVEIKAGLQYLEENANVALTYQISEGMIHYVRDIRISGNRRTPDKVIRRELVFQEGEPLVQAKLVESQQNLYALNIFDLVNIQRNKVPGQPGQEQILVKVQEMPLFYLGYGLRYNSEDQLEGFGDIKFNNLFGNSRNGLLYYRQNQWEKNVRFSLTDPYFFGAPIDTLHSFFLSNEDRAGLVTDEFGYTVEQQMKLPFSLIFSYLYRLSHIHTYDLESSGPFAYDFNWWLSEVSTHLIRDTRSDKLNARNGSFFSLSLTCAPEWLGSTFTYIKGFGQYSLYIPLMDKLIWASNLRLGLGDAFEQDIIIQSKRFFAGGGNSIRGFERDQVGPYSRFSDRPSGGEALFIMNQELRFPIYKWFSGVAFFDAGNVYRRREDFTPWDLRTSAGLGLRVNSPVGLLRLDYGFNLAPKGDEPRAVLFFSIGQSF